MVAILEKSEHNIDFHSIVDFIEASPLRIETKEEGTQILATVDGVLRTVIKLSLRRNLKLQDEEGISSFPDTKLFENLTFMGYNISPKQKFTFQKADEPASPLRDDSQGEACPTDSGFIAGQDRATIAKSSTLPYDLAPKVTSPSADKGSMQCTIPELTALCTSLQRHLSELTDKFQAQEVEINRLKERVKKLEVREGGAATNSGDDAPIKGRSMDEGEPATKRVIDDTEEMATVLTSMDAANEEVPTTSPVFATATVVTLYRRIKGKEVMVESETLKKQKLQEQVDAQIARELKEQLEREDQRRAEQIARDAEIARIHAEEELQKAERIKRKGINLEQESAKKQKSSEEITEEAKSPKEVTEEKIKEMMQLVPIEQVYMEALQVKHPIIDWEHLDMDDLNQLWSLVKETLSKRPATSDKEMELWVKLSRLYEPNMEDQLWTHTQNFMHALAEWKLYDKCGVHQLTSKDKDIFMLVEKEYPLRKGLALLMIIYKLQVENYSQMAANLVRKIYNIANSPRHQGD
nr:hypothetical protein [Tanacetum cinerariifolium]